VHARVRRKSSVRETRPLVIAGDEEDGHAAIGYAPQGLVRLIRHRRCHRRPIEHVARVDDEIDFTRQSRLEGGCVVRQKVMAATPPIAARAHWQIEAQVGVGEQEDPNVV
jgi:hypothetical protein